MKMSAKKLLHSLFRSKRGFSLIEVTVAAAMLGVVSLSVLSLVKIVMKDKTKGNFANTVDEVDRGIAIYLQDATACNNTLNALGAFNVYEPSHGSFSDVWSAKDRLTNIRDFNNVVQYTIGNFYPRERITGFSGTNVTVQNTTAGGNTTKRAVLYDMYIDRFEMIEQAHDTSATIGQANTSGIKRGFIRIKAVYGAPGIGKGNDQYDGANGTDTFGRTDWDVKITKDHLVSVILSGANAFLTCSDGEVELEDLVMMRMCMGNGGVWTSTAGGQFECVGQQIMGSMNFEHICQYFSATQPTEFSGAITGINSQLTTSTHPNYIGIYDGCQIPRPTYNCSSIGSIAAVRMDFQGFPVCSFQMGP
jgi:prepilin-type N-terminal cleavage/methylation domain-containing protein